MTDRGSQKIKLSRLADHKNKFAVFNGLRSAFLHAKRCYAQCFDRSGHAGYGGHGCSNADVIGFVQATADTDAAATASQAVIDGAPCNGSVEILGGQFPQRSSR